jgi:hypothetical protein
LGVVRLDLGGQRRDGVGVLGSRWTNVNHRLVDERA